MVLLILLLFSGLQSGVQVLIVIALVIVLCVIVYAVLFQVQKHIYIYLARTNKMFRYARELVELPHPRSEEEYVS